jgi:hypothetical protein
MVADAFFHLKIGSLKGKVSRDFVVCFLVAFERSEVVTNKGRVRLLLKFCFPRIFLFSRLGVVSSG